MKKIKPADPAKGMLTLMPDKNSLAKIIIRERAVEINRRLSEIPEALTISRNFSDIIHQTFK